MTSSTTSATARCEQSRSLTQIQDVISGFTTILLSSRASPPSSCHHPRCPPPRPRPSPGSNNQDASLKFRSILRSCGALSRGPEAYSNLAFWLVFPMLCGSALQRADVGEGEINNTNAGEIPSPETPKHGVASSPLNLVPSYDLGFLLRMR